MWELAPFSSAQYGRAGASDRHFIALAGKVAQKAAFPIAKSSSVTSAELPNLRKLMDTQPIMRENRAPTQKMNDRNIYPCDCGFFYFPLFSYWGYCISAAPH